MLIIAIADVAHVTHVADVADIAHVAKTRSLYPLRDYHKYSIFTYLLQPSTTRGIVGLHHFFIEFDTIIQSNSVVSVSSCVILELSQIKIS